MSYLSALGPSLSALRASQLALEVLSNNVANANTEGYSRQVVSIQSSPDYKTDGGMWVGTGVQVTSVKRVRDAFLDVQIRSQLPGQASQSEIAGAYSALDRMLGEPGGGLSAGMNRFFAALQGATNQPQSISARQVLLDSAASLVDSFRTLSQQILGERSDLNTKVLSTVSEINGLSKQLAELNAKISYVDATTGSPNQLLDERDRLLDKITSLSGASYTIQNNGMATVALNGQPLVLANNSYALGTQPGPGGMVSITYGSPATVITPTNGALGGMLTARDTILPAMQSSIDTLAANLVSSVNTVHRRGFGMTDQPGLTHTQGVPAAFASVVLGSNANLRVGVWNISTTAGGALSAVFTPDGGVAQPALTGTIAAGGSNTTLIPGITLNAPAVLANASDTVTISGPARNLFVPAGITGSSIALDPSVAADPRLLALANSSNAISEGAKGQEMAELARSLLMNGGLTTFGEYWRNTVSATGSQAATNSNRLSTSNSIVEQFTGRRAQISSVSIDEEGADMLRLQRAFQAAARVLSAQDDMIQSLLSAVGAR